jgi:chemotaxis protein CheX
MTAQIATFDLPAVVKTEDCGRLDAFLREHANDPVGINCGLVERISGQAVQVLLAHRKCRSPANCIQLDAPTDSIESALNKMGLSDLLSDMRGAA